MLKKLFCWLFSLTSYGIEIVAEEGKNLICELPKYLIKHIVIRGDLSPTDRANLAKTCRTMRTKTEGIDILVKVTLRDKIISFMEELESKYKKVLYKRYHYTLRNFVPPYTDKDELGEKLIHLLLKDKTIYSLNFPDFHFSEAIATQLGRGLKENKNIRKLYLIANIRCLSNFYAYQINVPIDEIKPILQGIKANKYLQFFQFMLPFSKGKFMSDQIAQEFSDVLKENHTLKTLKLTGNHIDFTGVSIIAQALCENKSLEQLYLHNNLLTFEAGYSIGQMLTENKSLRYLNLDKNHLGNGVENIADGLKGNKTLQFLDLRRNSLTDQELMKLLEKGREGLSLFLTKSSLHLSEEKIKEREEMALEKKINLLWK